MKDVKMGLTIEEAAEMSGIGRNTMRKLVDWGKLPVLKVGRKTIIRRDALENFMTVNQLPHGVPSDPGHFGGFLDGQSHFGVSHVITSIPQIPVLQPLLCHYTYFASTCQLVLQPIKKYFRKYTQNRVAN